MSTIRKFGLRPLRFSSAASFAAAVASCSGWRNTGSRCAATSMVGAVIGSWAMLAPEDVDAGLGALERLAQLRDLLGRGGDAGFVQRAGRARAARPGLGLADLLRRL